MKEMKEWYNTETQANIEEQTLKDKIINELAENYDHTTQFQAITETQANIGEQTLKDKIINELEELDGIESSSDIANIQQILDENPSVTKDEDLSGTKQELKNEIVNSYNFAQELIDLKYNHAPLFTPEDLLEIKHELKELMVRELTEELLSGNEKFSDYIQGLLDLKYNHALLFTQEDLSEIKQRIKKDRIESWDATQGLLDLRYNHALLFTQEDLPEIKETLKRNFNFNFESARADEVHDYGIKDVKGLINIKYNDTHLFTNDEMAETLRKAIH